MRNLIGFWLRRGGTAFAIVDSRALLAAIESKSRSWSEGSQQTRGLELRDSVGTKAAGGPFKQELIHASALEVDHTVCTGGCDVDQRVMLRLLGQVRHAQEWNADPGMSGTKMRLLQANPARLPGSLPRPPAHLEATGGGLSACNSVEHAQTLSPLHLAVDNIRLRNTPGRSMLPENALQVKQSTIATTDESQVDVLALHRLAHENMASRNRQRGSYAYREDSADALSTDYEAAKQRHATVYDAVAGMDGLT